MAQWPLWFLVLLLSSAPARANGRSGLVQLGLDLYKHGDFKGCVIGLERALSEGFSNEDDRISALTYLASAYEALRNVPDARRTLRELLTDHPELTFDPALFPPSFLRLVSQVKRDLPVRAKAPMPAVEPSLAVVAPPSPALSTVKEPSPVPLQALRLSPAPAAPRPTGVYVLAGAAAAAVIAAAVFGGLDYSLRSSDHTTQVGTFTVHSLTVAQANAANRDGEIAVGLAGAGAALAGGAIAWDFVPR
jgi:hypothetical protein